MQTKGRKQREAYAASARGSFHLPQMTFYGCTQNTKKWIINVMGSARATLRFIQIFYDTLAVCCIVHFRFRFQSATWQAQMLNWDWYGAKWIDRNYSTNATPIQITDRKAEEPTDTVGVRIESVRLTLIEKFSWMENLFTTLLSCSCKSFRF